MSYTRVLPRDLFNESSLLKCYGRLWLLLDEARNHRARLAGPDTEGEPFEIDQDSSDGSIFISNIEFCVGERMYGLRRPLNSRDLWPLNVVSWESDFEPVTVFDGNGLLTPEMVAFIAK